MAAFFLGARVIYVFHEPRERVAGREMFLETTKRFYSTIAEVEVGAILIDGERACVLTHYLLRPPSGGTIESDVAEIFEVKDGKIVSFSIYFDTAPFPK